MLFLMSEYIIVWPLLVGNFHCFQFFTDGNYIDINNLVAKFLLSSSLILKEISKCSYT